MAYVIGPGCTDCGICCFSCPQGAVYDDMRRFVIDPHRCNDCGECLSSCPGRAILPASPGKRRPAQAGSSVRSL